MKKCFFLCLLAISVLALVSWGVTGHKAVGQIAENHLTPTTKLAIKKLLGSESLADVSNYADEIRSDARYKYTGAWHFANLAPGLTFDEFSNQLKNMKEDNVYKMVYRFGFDLKDPDKSKTQKAFALKFLVHFIGDLHQPMHVSNKEDRGGNDIKVSFMGDFYNLHGLWDSGLIEHQGLTYKEMATNYDTATPAEIKKWQSDDPMVWLWESYQISTILYQEAAADPKFEEDYYKSHIPVLEKRIEKGGIRLAGVLNSIFDGQK